MLYNKWLVRHGLWNEIKQNDFAEEHLLNKRGLGGKRNAIRKV